MERSSRGGEQPENLIKIIEWETDEVSCVIHTEGKLSHVRPVLHICTEGKLLQVTPVSHAVHTEGKLSHITPMSYFTS